jgi:hypothetical protein
MDDVIVRCMEGWRDGLMEERGLEGCMYGEMDEWIDAWREGEGERLMEVRMERGKEE